MRTSFCVIFLFFFSTFLFSQQSLTEESTFKNKVAFMTLAEAHLPSYLALHTHNKNFALSPKNEFITIQNQLNFKQPYLFFDLAKYIRSNVNTIWTSSIRFDIANYYFQRKSYPNALNWYNKTDLNFVPSSKRNDFYFKKGYSLFTSKKYDAAVPFLEKAVNTPLYTDDVNYYLGYIYYTKNSFKDALYYFNKVSSDSPKQKRLHYYRALIYFKQGLFDKIIDETVMHFTSLKGNEQSELAKVIGESYFKLGKYKEAVTYLKKYRGKRGRWSHEDFYQLGFAYYKIKNYKEATAQFNKIIGGKNALSQNAYYHLAICYLKENKKAEALNAFQKTITLDFDKVITEDAALKHVKLSYEIGNPYTKISDILTNFLAKYPKSPFAKEINDLLVTYYIKSKNFNAALNVLKNQKGYTNNTLLQKVTFLKGIELFNQGDNWKAISNFNKAIQNNKSLFYKARATYWKAQAFYKLNSFPKAIENYKTFLVLPKSKQTNEFKDIYYNLGYAYFKNKNYTQSAIQFKKAYQSKNLETSYKIDALLRLADSYFGDKKYWPALDNYEKLLVVNPNNPYALYQMAISYGFVSRNAKKISALNTLIESFPKSTLIDDGLFDLAIVYSQENQIKESLKTYDHLITKYPNSLYIPQSIVNKGILLYNIDETEKAEKTLKNLVEKYPISKFSNQAVTIIKEIAIEKGEVNKFQKWAANFEHVTISNNEIELASFTAAEKKYIENNIPQAKILLEEYTEKYPNGTNILTGKYYLSEIYFEEEDYTKAIPLYTYIHELAFNEYTERALLRLSQIYNKTNETRKAIPIWQKLEKVAEYTQNKIYAQSNLMKTYSHNNDMNRALTYAQKIVQLDTINSTILTDAQLIIARNSLKKSDTTASKKYYKLLEKSAINDVVVEALYHKALFLYTEKKHAESNEVISSIAKNHVLLDEWNAKSLLILAKNFFALEDNFQSTFILENIITNFQSQPDIALEARYLLDKIISAEQKVNSSISGNEITNTPENK